MDFLKRPQRLRAHLEVSARSAGDGVEIRADQGSWVFEQRIFEALIPLLDGSRSTPELARALVADHSYPELIQALVDLSGRGLLTEGRSTGDPLEPYWDSQGLPVLCPGLVAVRAIGAAAPSVLTEHLEGLGVAITPDLSHSELSLVWVQDYLDPELESFATAATGPWLPVMARGATAWIGPLFEPDAQPCFLCLLHRLRLTQAGRRWGQGALPALLAVASAQAATLAAHWLRGHRDRGWDSHLLEFRTDRGESRRHRVVARPQCSGCGCPTSAAARLELTDRELPGYRAGDAQEFLARFEHHVSPITGLVQELRSIGESEFKLYSAPYYSGPSPGGHTLQSAGGKGRTDAQARASALGEALERYCGSCWQDTAQLTASFEELGGDAIHPNEVMLFSERQLERSHRDAVFKHRVPEPLADSTPIAWRRLWSLTQGCWKFLPAGMFSYGQPLTGDGRYTVGCSNGMAAGSSLEDAILHGFFELVERDSVALWWYNRLLCPGVEIESLDPPFVSRLRAYYEQRGREFWLLDLTSDLGLPVFAAVSAGADDGGSVPVMGFGAHFDARLAAVRALTEMNQLQPYFLSQAERADRKAVDPAQREGTSLALRTAEHAYLRPDPERTPITPQTLLAPELSRALPAIERCRQLVEAQGLEMLCADLTRPDVGVPVAKVVVPGLRHFWRRLAPGRLYEAPVRDGRLALALTEDELNPIELMS